MTVRETMNSAKKSDFQETYMSTNDNGGKKEKGVDLTNLGFTPEGVVQGLPDEEILSDEALDSLAAGLLEPSIMDSDCGCTDLNSYKC
jgi:hypothetical protein